jgi:iron complex transport system substrate-binding protein
MEMARKIVPAPLARLMEQCLDAAYQVHTDIGPGCLERVYELSLAAVLRERGFSVERQVPVPFEYRGVRMPVAFRADLVVDDALVIEAKSTASMVPVHQAQLTTYLRLSGKPLGLLLCFGAEHLREGYDRVVHPEYAFLPPSRVPSAAGPTGTSGTTGTSRAATQAQERTTEP